jgi:hypothetical protein
MSSVSEWVSEWVRTSYFLLRWYLCCPRQAHCLLFMVLDHCNNSPQTYRPSRTHFPVFEPVRRCSYSLMLHAQQQIHILLSLVCLTLQKTRSSIFEASPYYYIIEAVDHGSRTFFSPIIPHYVIKFVSDLWQVGGFLHQ